MKIKFFIFIIQRIINIINLRGKLENWFNWRSVNMIISMATSKKKKKNLVASGNENLLFTKFFHITWRLEFDNGKVSRRETFLKEKS